MQTMTGQIEHVGIAVESIEKALEFYQGGLGMRLEEVATVEEQGVRVAFLPAGDSAIELLEPLGADSTMRAFLEKRGEGIHHICLAVDDLQVALDNLSKQGYRLIDETPRKGAHGLVAFVHPRSAHGVLIELMERH
jgi:methylmalonyl-CoA epimerase